MATSGSTPSASTPGSVTRLILSAVEQGDARAAVDLLPLVYQELRRLAAQRLANEQPGQTLQATALVHEAYLRLVGPAGDTGASALRWDGRAHFFAAAAEAMRRILIDNARRKKRVKHGGDRERQDLDAVDPADLAEISTGVPSDDLLALDEALERFARMDPAKAELVKLRYFAGLTLEEAGRMLGISPATADRHWAFARAWLYKEIHGV
jgi:RNA polymerase sigma factor (TIGR02999 family)